MSGKTHKKWHFVLRCSGWESWGETVFVQCLMGVSIVGMFVVQERRRANGGVQKESSLTGIRNKILPITDISTRFQVHLPPCKSLANSFAHLGNRIKVFLAGNKQTNLGQAAPSSAWVGSRHLNVRLSTSRVKFNIQPGFEITCNFTIMHCHHQIGFRG